MNMRNKAILNDPEAMAILQKVADMGWTPKMVYTAMNELAEQAKQREPVEPDPEEDYKQSLEAMYDHMVPLDSDFGG